MSMSELEGELLRLEQESNSLISAAEHNVTRLTNYNNLLLNTPSVISELDAEFENKTKLDHQDIPFLFLTIALQCVRQYFVSNESFRFEDEYKNGKLIERAHEKGDKMMERIYDDVVGRVAPADWKNVLFQSVPYDAIKTSDLFQYSTELSGANHRYRTLGHDPILGWVFGTTNIMTSSLTRYDVETFYVSNNIIARRYPHGTIGMFEHAVTYAQKEPELLAVSVARQMIHYGVDYFTKQGLPAPLVATVNNDLASKMIRKGHIDTLSIMRSAGLSTLINSLVYTIRNFLYNGNGEIDQKLFDVKTRRIIDLANVIASTSNVIYVGMTQDFNKLDIGGLGVTLYRLISDTKFINEVKREFVLGSYIDMVRQV